MSRFPAMLLTALPLLPSSAIRRVLTKLKPRNSSWAVALGGISGESEIQWETAREHDIALSTRRSNHTFGGFGSVLRIEVERIVGTTDGWLVRRLNFLVQQFDPIDRGEERVTFDVVHWWTGKREKIIKDRISSINRPIKLKWGPKRLGVPELRRLSGLRLKRARSRDWASEERKVGIPSLARMICVIVSFLLLAWKGSVPVNISNCWGEPNVGTSVR